MNLIKKLLNIFKRENFLKLGEKLLGSDVIKEFKVTDVFNSNEISGVICKEATFRYGALVIFKVNGKKVKPQIIWGTPKFHYPFYSHQDRRIYKFPKIKRFCVYEKLDGTNILGYSYEDNNGKKYTTYKTRLSPIVRGNKFGDFAKLWFEMLEKYPEIKNLNYDEFNYSFELYGFKNLITIQYKVDLETRLLFKVDRENHKIYPTEEKLNLECLYSFNNTEDIVALYERFRNKAQEENKQYDDYIEGVEGYMFYILTENNEWIQYKLKPEMIEMLHWCTGGIPPISIRTTVMNALENVEVEELNIGFIKELLKEEYNSGQIEKSLIRINKTIEEVKEMIFIQRNIKEIYESIKWTNANDKREVMREMSKHFSGSIMRKVFSYLQRSGVELN